MSLAGIGALAALVASGIVPPVRFLPSAAAMLDVPAILLGTLAGGAVLATMAYMSFSAVVRITSESFMSILAFSPVTTWAFQEIGVALGLIAVPRPDAPLVAAMGAIIAAVLLILWSNRRAGPR